ncbi:alpha/beta fold hydrolase [Croceiramulus getboli]|nr:alpha/beta hydrolase [Flavobacteriaceae bacterium YJPT1-3]
MSFIESSSTEKDLPITLYFEDFGEGQPVILIHGWPLSSSMWEYQKQAIVDAGFRCLTYDRRGFGKSDQPWEGYNYDTMAADLHDIISFLELEEVILVGFSMGGGEVARYIGNYGTQSIAKAILVGAVTPFMLKTEDNPDGVPQEVFDDMKSGIQKDRASFLNDFGKNFVNFEKNKDRVSESQVHWNWNIAMGASAKATLDCIDAFGQTDFRADLKKFDIPTLVVHGDADQIVPLEKSGKRSAAMIDEAQLEIMKGAPHGLPFTHTEEFNEKLIAFMKA